MFVDEASQASDADMVTLFNSIAFSSIPYDERWPRISLLGDPYQLPPNTRTQRPQCYYYTKKLSFLERMTPEGSPYLRGLNKIPTVQLNIQYRMVPPIAAVANVVSRRNVRTRITNRGRVDFIAPIPDPRYPPFLYNGFFGDLVHADISNHVMWFDPYVDPRNAQVDILQELNDEIGNQFLEVSPLEAVALEAVYTMFMVMIGEMRFVRNTAILSP